jgi:ATP-dependent 26S proteasome regulatory subunit
VLLEDLDRLDVGKGLTQKGLALSDLLNDIDGVNAAVGRILIVTANNPEQIDPALLRSGRIDRKFCIDYAGEDQLKSFYNAVSKERNVPSWEQFLKALPDKITIADAQSLLFGAEIAKALPACG